MKPVYQEKLGEIDERNKLLIKKYELLKEAKKPVLSALPEYQQEVQVKVEYHQEPLDSLSAKDYLKAVGKKFKEIDERVKEVLKKQEKYLRQSEKVVQKKKETIFRKPVIKTKDQIEKEKRDKEEQRLNQFIQEMVDKYSPFLKQAEKQDPKEDEILYQQQFQSYLAVKDHKEKQQLAYESLQKPKFELVKPQIVPLPRQPLQCDLVADQTAQEEKRQDIAEKRAKGQRMMREQRTIFTILDEKTKAENKTLNVNFRKIVSKIFNSIDKDRCKYVSKVEILEYFQKYPIFIDIFDLKWDSFRDFVLKVKALRKGLLTLDELIVMLQDQKLKITLEESISRIKSKDKSEYQLPKEYCEHPENLETPQQAAEQNKDAADEPEKNQIDFSQLQELTKLNKMYQDANFPVYVEELKDRKILIARAKDQGIEPAYKKNLSKEFVEFANKMHTIQENYQQNKLAYQMDEGYKLQCRLLERCTQSS